MWRLSVNLKDSTDATAFLAQIDTRSEVTGAPGVRVTKYPNDRQAVATAMDRAPLAGLGTWALTFPSARIALADDYASQEG